MHSPLVSRLSGVGVQSDILSCCIHCMHSCIALCLVRSCYLLSGAPVWHFPYACTLLLNPGSFGAVALFIQSPSYFFVSSSFVHLQLKVYSIFNSNSPFLSNGLCVLSSWCVRVHVDSTTSVLTTNPHLGTPPPPHPGSATGYWDSICGISVILCSQQPGVGMLRS